MKYLGILIRSSRCLLLWWLVRVIILVFRWAFDDCSIIPGWLMKTKARDRAYLFGNLRNYADDSNKNVPTCIFNWKTVVLHVFHERISLSVHFAASELALLMTWNGLFHSRGRTKSFAFSFNLLVPILSLDSYTFCKLDDLERSRCRWRCLCTSPLIKLRLQQTSIYNLIRPWKHKLCRKKGISLYPWLLDSLL